MRKFSSTFLLIGVFSLFQIPLFGQLLTFSVATETVSCEQQNFISVPVTVNNFIGIGGVQFAITWDTAVLQFEGHSEQFPPSALIIEDSTANGELRVGWLDLNPPYTGESIADGTAIVTLAFSPKVGANNSSSVEIGALSGFPMVVSDGGGSIIPNSLITINQGVVSIFDNVAPVIADCPDDIDVQIGINDNTATVNWTEPTASDNCALKSFNSSFSTGDNFSVGTTTVSYTATDNGNNQDNCNFDIIVTRAIAPGQPRFELENLLLDCEEDSTVVTLKVYNFEELSSFQFGIKWDTSIIKFRRYLNFLPPAATFLEAHPDSSNLGIRWADFNLPIGENINDGVAIISFVFDNNDAGIKTSSLQFVDLPLLPIEVTKNGTPIISSEFQLVDGSVGISDLEKPAINDCPRDMAVFIPLGTNEASVNWTPPTASDNCSLASLTSNFNPNDLFQLGSTTIEYIATDEAANSDTCSFEIKIEEHAAAGLPMFQIESETVDCKADSVVVALRVFNFDTISSFQFKIAWDTSVIKYRRHINLLPPAATFLYEHPDSSSIAIRWADFTFPVGENIDDNEVIVNLVFDIAGEVGESSPLTFASGLLFPIEVTKEGFLLNNSGYGLIEGIISIQDEVEPVISNCPTNMTVTALVGTTGMAVSWTPPTATDNCSLASLNSNFNTNDNFPIGITQVEYVALDESNNSDTCRFNIVVEAPMSPQPKFTSCPVSASIPVLAGSCDATHTWTEPTLNTTVGLDSLKNNHKAGDTFSLGTTDVIYIAYSPQGTDTCRFDITVFDDEDPAISDCPTDINVSVSQSTAQVPATWTAPTASDNCNVASFNSNFNSTDMFPVGATIVEYIALDDVGNSDTCKFEVIVTQNISPQPMFTTCPIDTTLNADTLQCSTTYAWTEPTLNSTVGLDSLISSHSSGDNFAVGITEISYIAYSAQGTDTCSFNITVFDKEAPIVPNCPSNMTIQVDPSTCRGVGNWVQPVPTDNCGINSFLVTHAPNYEFPIGSLDVLMIAADNSGNSAVCNFTVTVVDTIKPYFPICSGDIEVLVDGSIVSDPDSQILLAETDNCMGTRLYFSPPFARDSCSFVNTIQTDGTNLTSGSTFPIGTNQLSYEAIDNAGNIAECAFNIIVHPLPTLNAEVNGGNTICEGDDIELKAFMPSTGFSYEWTGPNMFSSSNAVDSIFDITSIDNGTYTVTATSAADCSSSTDVTVQVNAKPDVEIDHNDVLCADGSSDLNLTVVDNANAGVTDWSWTGPQNFMSDNQTPTISSVGINEAGIYKVTGTTAAGCFGTDEVDIQISTAPVMPTLTVTNNDLELCVGESTTITGTLFTGNSPVHTWSVNPSTGYTLNMTGPHERIYSFDTPGSYIVTYWGAVNGCPSDRVSITINVTAAPDLNLTSNAPFLCSDGTEILELSETIGDATSYSWKGPDSFNSVLRSPSVQNVSADNAGFYVLTAIAGDGCTSRDSIEVEVSLGPDPMMPSVEPVDSSICLGSSVELLGQAYTHPNGVTYKWFQKLELTGNLFGISNNRNVTVEPTRTGTYKYLYVVEVGSCATDTATVTITVTEGPKVGLAYNDPLTCIDENTDLELSEIGGAAVKWDWSGPLSFTSDVQNPVISNITKDNAGTYEVTVIDANGCSATGTINVVISEGIEPLTVTVNNENPCEDLDSLILSTAFIPGATYNWTGPVTINNTNNTVIVPFPTDEDSGEYMVSVTTADGCTSDMSAPMMVDVLTAPEAVMDYVLVLFETPIDINVLGNDTFNLSRPLTISTISEPFKGALENMKDGTFRYTPREKQLDEDYFTYQICYEECPMLCSEAVVTFDIKHDPNQCVIPTVITPNGDSKNDVLKISCIEAGTFPNNEMIIFNEWGNQVFQTKSYNNEWDGTYKGKPLPDGTYYYLFFRNENAQPQKGYVTLYR